MAGLLSAVSSLFGAGGANAGSGGVQPPFYTPDPGLGGLLAGQAPYGYTDDGQEITGYSPWGEPLTDDYSYFGAINSPQDALAGLLSLYALTQSGTPAFSNSLDRVSAGNSGLTGLTEALRGYDSVSGSHSSGLFNETEYQLKPADNMYDGTAQAEHVTGRTEDNGVVPFVRLYGGDDRYDGTSVAENIAAGAGNDRVMTGGGADSVFLDSGDDSAVMTGQERTAGGGEGVDLLDYSALSSPVKADLGSAQSGTVIVDGHETSVSSVENIVGGSGDDTLYGDDLTDYGGNLLAGDGGADELRGRVGPDLLIGGFGNDRLYGGEEGEDDGDDRLYGASGNDALYGAAGNDVLDGGGGTDRLTGGSGADRFTYDDFGQSSASAPDVITDFSAEDVLDLRKLSLTPEEITFGTRGPDKTILAESHDFEVVLADGADIQTDQILL